MRYQKRVVLLITVVTVLKLIFSTATGLGADEVYYWTFANRLQWNYFDHPPMVALLIRLTTGNLFFHNELAVRLGAILCSAACTWLIFKLGTLISNMQVGWFAALLYSASVYCSITARTNVLPDSPQMVFWLASLILLMKISRLTGADSKANGLWYLFGISTGLCMMSKVHGVFLWVGALLYVLFIHREWLKSRALYFSALITLVIVSPIIIWNFQNNFITYKFHSARVNPVGNGIDLLGLGKVILGQAANNNPINFLLIYISLILFFRGKLPLGKIEVNILLFCSLPLIAFMLFVSFFKDTYPYWPGPAYSSLLVLPAIWLDSRAKNKNKIVPGVVKWGLAYLFLVAFLQLFPGNDIETETRPENGR